MPEGVLLNSAADLVDDLGAEPDDVKGVEDRNRVGQLVTDRVGIAPERIQRSLFDAGGEPVGLGLQPALVRGSGASHDGVEKSGVEASVLVTGQIDHDRHGPIGAHPRGPPDVLIDSKGLHSGKAFGLSHSSLGFGLDRGPGGVPGDAEMTGQRRHSGVVVGERIGGPSDCPHRQHRTRRCDRMLFGERRCGTARFETPPHSDQPSQHRDPAQARRVMKDPAASAMPDRKHPAAGAAMLKLI